MLFSSKLHKHHYITMWKTLAKAILQFHMKGLKPFFTVKKTAHSGLRDHISRTFKIET